MEFTSLLMNTPLMDLNTKPLRFLDEAPPPLPPPPPPPPDYKEERGALIEELNRVSAENKKLTELLTVMCENYTELRNQLLMEEHTISKNIGALNNNNNTASRKRKAESRIDNNANNKKNGNIIIGNNNIGHYESSSSDEDSSKKPKEEHMMIKAKISRVFVRTEASDRTLIVKDGYQWRKYGQKVTRDNPCPRAYFKCSFAPSCPVKKKVQRSIEDQSIVVATYEGEHNHPHDPTKPETTTTTMTTPPVGSNRNLTLGDVPWSSTSLSSSAGRRKQPSHHQEETRSSSTIVDDAVVPVELLHHYLVEQMASTLTKDPSFKAALAVAISGKFLQQNNN